LFNQLGYANSVHSQHVKAPERSGLYYFRASTASGQQFSFPWVVAPKKPSARLAVLASNLTWNAYNSFGGRSNYIHADGLPRTPTINSRVELKRYSDSGFLTWNSDNYPPLSFDRPEPYNHINFDEKITDPIESRQGCHLAPAEWRLLGWLERENFAYDYYAETQLHNGTLDLSQYKALITSVHPEYWTEPMFTMVCHNGKLTGLDTKGLGGFESRYAIRYESEAGLLGVVFTPAGAMTGAPYRVQDGSHWVFENTGLKSGDLFGEKSLHRRCPGGASGHETDKVSPSSPAGITHLAKGTNENEGGAQMITFDTPSGGKVFSVGSINYVSSLPIDEKVSQITSNVLRRFLV
ncbi:carboxypeptidase regulatory-like domain-containing protein, partial [bacterium]|nr:carboxypeptidase regulatory-like domain-containing protein [bacterium]